MAPAYDVARLNAESVIKSNFAALFKELSETLQAGVSGPQPCFGPVISLSSREKDSMSQGGDRISMNSRSQACGVLDAKDLHGNCSLPRCWNRSSICANATQKLQNNLPPKNLCKLESGFSDKDRTKHLDVGIVLHRKRIPPEVPKRTSSITTKSMDGRPMTDGESKSDQIRSLGGGSLSSVQSSGSESSVTGSGSDRATPSGKSVDINESHSFANGNVKVSVLWKHNSQVTKHLNVGIVLDRKRIPPEIPKRKPSITTKSMDVLAMQKSATEGESKSDMVRSLGGGSLSRVQSFGSESSVTSSGSHITTPSGKSVEINQSHVNANGCVEVSQVWKHKSQVPKHLNVGVVLDRKRIPPKVPKRTSSITTKSMDVLAMPKSVTEGGRKSDMVRSLGGGSLSSVQSSGSESSGTGSGSDRATPSCKMFDKNGLQSFANGNVDLPALWKRNSQVTKHLNIGVALEHQRLSNISENSEDCLEGTDYSSSPIGSEVVCSSRNYQPSSLRVPNACSTWKFVQHGSFRLFCW